MKYNFVAVEGNIGAGKTTLATILSDKFSGRLLLEEFKNNAILPQFYQNPEKFALELELSFLQCRVQQMNEFMSETGSLPIIFSDYMIEKCLLFSKNTLRQSEYTFFEASFKEQTEDIIKPEVIIYLKSNIETLLDNISKRGRSYEQNIENQYLAKVSESYENYFRSSTELKIIEIDASKADFVNNSEDISKLLALLNEEIPTGITKMATG